MNSLPRVAAGGLATIAMLLFPVAAFAQDALDPTAPAETARAGGGGGGGGGGNGGGGGGLGGVIGGGGQDDPKPLKMNLKLKGLKNGKVKVGDRVNAIVNVRPFVPGQRGEIRLSNRGDVVKKKTPLIRQVKGKNMGRFHLRSDKLMKAGKYRVRVHKDATKAQEGGNAKSREFKLRYPDLDPGDSNSAVALFNDLLRKEGYYTSGGDKYTSHTERAVMAFRKVNGMARTFQATPGIFAKLAAGKGAFNLKYPNAGRHVEVDISKQVMVLADNGKPVHTFHVSTGAAATPSDQGGYTFYRREPGFNSLGMYYSVYYNRGEAIHGYHSVPPYPASHGCIRNPIPDSKFIYNWVQLGMKIWVYR